MKDIMLYAINGDNFREYKLPKTTEGIIRIEIKNYSENELIYNIPVYANDGNWSVGEVDSLSIRINGKAYDRWICDKDIITVTSLDGKPRQ